MHKKFYYLEFGHQYARVQSFLLNFELLHIYRRKVREERDKKYHSSQSECIVDTYIDKHQNICSGIVRSAISQFS